MVDEATPVEGQPTPEVDMNVWNDATRDAIKAKYGGDIDSLTKGYFNSQQAFSKAGEESKSISTERADFVQERQQWASEREGHASALEAAMESETTAADINQSVFDAVQDDIVANKGEITDQTRESMMKLFNNDKAFVDRHVKLVAADVNERFTSAQESVPSGTDVKELLNFVNTDATKEVEESVFSAAELQYFQDRANRGDYGFVAQVEEKYLASLGKGEKAKKVAKVPAHSNRGTSHNPDSFATSADYEAAKKDPKFQRDFLFREEVERKYRNSDVTAFANEKMVALYGPEWDKSNPAIRGG